MILSIYLHSYIVNTLQMYGELNDVINKILDESDAGNFDIVDKPECENRIGAGRYNVSITNTNYVKLLQTYGVKNKRISLRRLLYWFVDNEIYADLGWEPLHEYDYKVNKQINKCIDIILVNLNKLEYLTKNNFDDLRDIINSHWRN